MATIVRNGAAVARCHWIELNVGLKIVKISFHRCFLIVVIDFAIAEPRVAYSQIKNARMAAALSRLNQGKITLAFTVNLHMHDRMLNEKFAHAYFALQCGLN